ncbi:Ig-like domain-containing protein [Azotobacter sp. CWF10]
MLVSGLEAGASWEYSSDGGQSWSAGSGERFVLAEGRYAAGAVQVRQTDAAGNVGAVGSHASAIIVDVTAPQAPSLGLSEDSDTGAIGDGSTELDIVTLSGQAEAGSQVVLEAQNLSALVGPNGSFTLPDVALADGLNSLDLQIVDAAGNTTTFTLELTRTTDTDSEDPVLVWMSHALESIRLDAATPLEASRALAMESIAVFDVLNAIDGKPAYLVSLDAPADVSAGGAVAAAAQRVLAYLFPSQESALADLLESALAELPSDAARAEAVAFGRAVADAIIAVRDQDGWDTFVTYNGGTAPGEWRPTPSAFEPALAPQWGSLETFAIASGDQFRPDGPPDLSSAEYAAALNDVQRLGSATSSERTAEQTQIARFWADGSGSYTPPGHWNQIAAQLIEQSDSDIFASARTFAMLNIALADTSIAAWDTKYTYGGWRPITAIRQADLDGNDATAADSNWSPLLNTPNHPDYVSGHSSFSGAAAEVLGKFSEMRRPSARRASRCQE